MHAAVAAAVVVDFGVAGKAFVPVPMHRNGDLRVNGNDDATFETRTCGGDVSSAR